jgi:GTP cyclohydrolase I
MDAIDTLTYPFTAPRVLEPRGESMVRGLIEEIGEDPEREGLVRTPHRVWESLSFLTDGYEGDVMDVVGDAIEFYSLCEHHMLPFFGVCHVAYIPDGRIIGLSKIPRVVDLFSHRLQVQERLTTQIADGLDEALQPKGLGVVLEASHLCMMMRGVEKQSSRTATSAMRGLFRSDPQARGEFLNLIKGS